MEIKVYKWNDKKAADEYTFKSSTLQKALEICLPKSVKRSALKLHYPSTALWHILFIFFFERFKQDTASAHIF